MEAAPAAIDGFPAFAFVTGRAGGVSGEPFASLNLATQVGDSAGAVARNRAIVAAWAGRGVTPAPTVFMRPDHGTAVVRIARASADARGPSVPSDAADAADARVVGIGPVPPIADILVTREPGMALASLAADCVPLLGSSPDGRTVMAAHVGRRGLAAGTVAAAVAALREASGTAEVAIHIGPAICAACYEVSAQLRDEVAAVVPQAHGVTRSGTPAIDLVAGVLAQLAGAGVTRPRVDGRCTAEAPELFSYRRDGVTGRHAAVVVCRP